MDSGTASAGIQDAPLPACVPLGRGSKTPRCSAAAQARCSTKCPLTLEVPTFNAESEPQHRSWADLLPDILGVVLGRLPRVEDRARMRSVCHSWHAASRLHRRPPPPPPLPLLVLSNFLFSSFGADGALTGTRRVPLPAGELASGDVRCVGSFEGWLVAAQLQPNANCLSGDIGCFLMNFFSWEIIHLPPPPPDTPLAEACSRSLPVINGSGAVDCTVHAKCLMSFHKVILSSSPDSASSCVVAAFSFHMLTPKLALWRPGMTSWCVCDGSCITAFSDIAFYQGKLYMFSMLDLDIFSFEISEDDSGLIVSRIEHCVMEKLPKPNGTYIRRSKIVEWHGKLLLVVPFFTGAECWQNIRKIGVFEVDLSPNPARFIEINSLDGDCIFISPCSSKPFCVSQYDGGEDDLLYFIDSCIFPRRNAPHYDKFVYSMKDGTVVPFAAAISEKNLQVPDGRPMYPTWLFPSE
ncbi:hypothetical protein EJB05_54200, partial [Eragrostis curvula]